MDKHRENIFNDLNLNLSLKVFFNNSNIIRRELKRTKIPKNKVTKFSVYNLKFLLIKNPWININTDNAIYIIQFLKM